MFVSTPNITNLVSVCQPHIHPHGYINFHQVGENGGMSRKSLGKPPSNMDFPNRIAEMAISQGMNQAQLAKKMDKSPQAVGRFWNGVRGLKHDWIPLFENALGYPGWMLTCDLVKKDMDFIKSFLDLSRDQRDVAIQMIEFAKRGNFRLAAPLMENTMSPHILPDSSGKKVK
jgi:transcriptional regulator with XRE-family HTH domain